MGNSYIIWISLSVGLILYSLYAIFALENGLPFWPRRKIKRAKVKFNFKKFLKEMANEFALCEYCRALMPKDTNFCPKCGKRNWKLWLECIRKGKI